MTWLAAAVVALVGGRIVTLAGPPIEEGTVVIRDGKIDRVTADRNVPTDARVVDCKGKTITPGLVAADTRIGAVEISLEASSRDFAVSESEDDQNHAAFVVADGINPRTTLIPIARLEGITSTVSVPEGALISGQSTWLDLTGPDVEQMIVKRSLAMHASVGGTGASAIGGSRSWAWTRLREMLDDARTYGQERSLFDRNQLRKLAGSRLDLEALGRVTRRELPLVLAADREADLLTALSFAKEQGIRVVLSGGAEAWRVADRLAEARVPVLVDPTDNLPGSFDSLSSRLDNAALLSKAGVSVGITLRGESHNARTLRQVAGIAAAYGLPHDEALATASRNVAQAFGMDRDYGTIEPGKVANVVVWTGDPLELSTQVAGLWVKGAEIPLVSRQTELRERYRTLH